MHFETALNLAWLSLGLFALASAFRAAFHTRTHSKWHSAWLHVIGVGLIVAALFPYISATDDEVRLANFNSQHEHQHSGKQRTDDLMRLYETMDTPLVCRTSQVVVILCFIALVFTPVLRTIDRIAPFRAGRSPPLQFDRARRASIALCVAA